MRCRPPLLPSLTLSSLLIACTSTEPGAPERTEAPGLGPVSVEAEPNPVEHRDGPEYFFAVVGQTGYERCPDAHGSPTWLDLQTTLGWVPTSGTPNFEPLMEQPVLARGQAGSAPERPALDVKGEPCPVRQMRSDWVNTPRGIRSYRTDVPDIEHFHATSVRRLDELTVTREDDEIVVSFTNPLPFALTEVQLELYYEGCYGKPGSTSRASAVVTLAPSQTLSWRFWLIAEHEDAATPKAEPSRRQHAASAIVLSLGEQAGPDGATVHADLDVALRDLGIDFECPSS
ncbi:hypothetical protein ENSA5_01090 [Enhygromyxa salina]|uniref:Lipoprotein n=1 Tax=Enhygromyxa salina TaxID=215803 RepID=A0A2S9YL10_9BACT|nr:hypothetical protein [Enhygromyxa salina]PRQ05789.1 hypothetical protein ENSA5_01090 [Enhygromyxa salina]